MRQPGEVKRGQRVDLNAPGILTDSEGNKTAVTVVDLSSGGCRVLTDGTPLIGEEVRLRVGRIADYPAKVRWALGNEAGLEFIGSGTPIDK